MIASMSHMGTVVGEVGVNGFAAAGLGDKAAAADFIVVVLNACLL